VYNNLVHSPLARHRPTKEPASLAALTRRTVCKHIGMTQSCHTASSEISRESCLLHLNNLRFGPVTVKIQGLVL